MVRDARDLSSQNFTITNFTEDLALDCDAAAVAETNDVLATLIQELQRQGIIRADIS